VGPGVSREYEGQEQGQAPDRQTPDQGVQDQALGPGVQR